MRTMKSNLRGQTGLTLTELMVAMTVAGLLLAAGYGVFRVQQKTYAVQSQVVEIQQNARVAVNLLTRDLRMAGHGVPRLWTVDIGGNTYSHAVTTVGTAMTLLGCFGAPRGYLSTSADKGDTQIDLVDASAFDNEDRRYVFIGEYDKAIIIDEIDGNTVRLNQGLKKRYPTTRLTANADPGATQISVAGTSSILIGDILILGDERLHVTGIGGNLITFSNPLQLEHISGTRVNPIPVYFVQALQYNRGSNGTITRQDLAGGGRQTVAENIGALVITQIEPGTYEIALTARTDVADETGRYRSRAYQFTVRVRNPF